jgi:hypothetical protein
MIAQLTEAKAQLQDGTTWLMQNGMSDFNNAVAASMDYLQLFGLTALAYMWVRMSKTALDKMAGGADDPFYADKLVTARYYMERVLPESASHLAKLKTGAGSMMALAADRF